MRPAAVSLAQAIADQAVEVFYLQPAVDLLREALEPSEQVEKLVDASYDWSGLLALTDRRLLFVRVRRFFGRRKIISHQYRDIHSVEVASSLGKPVLKVRVAGRNGALSFTLISKTARTRAKELADYL